MQHLRRLEAESIHVMREVVAQFRKPVMLYSIGKDSSVMLHLAMKAFYPAKPPFPLLHVDTTWKFREMISFRDQRAADLGLELLVHTNPDGLRDGVGPISHGSAAHTDIMKTQALKQALDHHGFDAAFGGARRDEEKAGPRSEFFPSERATIAGTRKISGPNCGRFTTGGSPRAKAFAFSSPIGPNWISGNISTARTFRWCRCISPNRARWSIATAD